MFARSAQIAAMVLLALVALPPGEVEAQNGSLQGIVSDGLSGQVLAGAAVALESQGGATLNTLTDRSGLFLIGGIAPGSYTLRLRFIGYREEMRPVEIAPGANLTMNVGLQVAPILMEGVDVDIPEAGGVLREMGRQMVTPNELRRIPTPAASGDLATYLQTLPGVVTTGDRGGQLFVRGGSHTENLALMDGLLIYQPFHIMGAFSVFPEDLVASVDFYAGGFGARYGGRTSSVLDVQMRDGNRTEFKGGGSVGPVMAELTAEGPASEGTISWLFSARRSFLDETAESLMGEPVPITFESQFLKVTSFTDDPHSRCSLTALRTSDHGRMDPSDQVSRVGWKNLALGTRCVVLLTDGLLRLVDVSVGYSAVTNEAISRGATDLDSHIRRLFLDANFSNLLGAARLDWGGFLRLEQMHYDVAEIYGGASGEGYLWDAGGYFDLNAQDGERLTVLPGVRMSVQPIPGFEPRLRIAWRPWGRDSEEVTGAFGYYRQSLAGISDVRDASSVFIVWKPYEGDDPVAATHAQVGWQQQIGNLNWAVEGYLRELSNISIPLWQVSADFTTTLALADGRVRGVDARVEYSRGPFYGFLGYGYGHVLYRSSQQSFGTWFGETLQSFNPPHDRRHQVNVVGSLDVGEFNVSARWQFGSGLPYTRPMGFDEFFDTRSFVRPPNLSFGETRLIVEKPYQGRLTTMHRLDLSVQREWELSFGRLEARGGAMNLYDRTNIFYYDVFLDRRVDQLPLFPYVAVKFTGG